MNNWELDEAAAFEDGVKAERSKVLAILRKHKGGRANFYDQGWNDALEVVIKEIERES